MFFEELTKTLESQNKKNQRIKILFQVNKRQIQLRQSQKQSKYPTISRDKIYPKIMKIMVKNWFNLELPSFRFYRICSQITEREIRLYQADNNSFRTRTKGTELSTQPLINTFSKLLRPSYKLKLVKRKEQTLVDFPVPDQMRMQFHLLQTRFEQTIPCVIISPNRKCEYVMIYSHSNATDIGYNMDSYLDMADNLSVTVIGYDYAGFGQSTGISCDQSALADLEEVYRFVTTELKFPFHHIILYGQSIGAGVSVALAANRDYPVAGIVIDGGFLSGLRTYFPKLRYTYKCDIFPCIEYIKLLNCLVFIIHGQSDCIVQCEHAERLKQLVKREMLYDCWIIEGVGHNKAKIRLEEYFFKLRAFIKRICDRENYTSINELSKKLKADRSIIKSISSDSHASRKGLSSRKSIKESSFGAESSSENRNELKIHMLQFNQHNQSV